MKCLVVGGNGFIGSHLVDGLSRAGHDVSAFDRFRTPPTFNTRGVRVLQGDFFNRSDLADATDGQEVVLHFLSTSDPARSEDDPTLDVRTNLTQSLELLEASARAGVRQFVYASTGGAIYGPQADVFFDEDMMTRPISPYGIGKEAVEGYLRYFALKYGMDTVSLRISNPYGPRQRPEKTQGLIPIALNRISRGDPVVRFGDGTMVRDYLWIEDLIDVIVRVAGSTHLHSVYNVGSGIGHSVNDVLAVLRSVTGIDFEIESQPPPATFVEHVVLRNTRLRDEFGLPDFTTLEDGVRLLWNGLAPAPR
ncbi:NAD-dependent epimerase/dehydratase family protein [Humibacter ginsenosidimutans]|uniref:NAD-dependent epimerase/dehydratase family protein n=1 Tax=Humibacter ginsenosidimutans TaxID=2599293 RepID=A0A5B8M887_9MICO|nr:NAD-dependent epimerase/dehydratase family protein [Humibacter ginsenosidimutans]QDZ16431.1 NAD-dependent epimerase/dehydratase family protein [Humibacter ginsenosidimutans]